jgi:hypothetical protein
MPDAGRKSKKEARYAELSVHLPQRCGNCSMFREPTLCTLVQGKIDRAGWCRYWEARKAKAA